MRYRTTNSTWTRLPISLGHQVPSHGKKVWERTIGLSNHSKLFQAIRARSSHLDLQGPPQRRRPHLIRRPPQVPSRPRRHCSPLVQAPAILPQVTHLVPSIKDRGLIPVVPVVLPLTRRVPLRPVPGVQHCQSGCGSFSVSAAAQRSVVEGVHMR